MTVSGKHRGVDGKLGEFFKQARRSGPWPEAEAAHRSAVTKARSKLPWEVLQSIHQEAVQLASDCWPDTPESTWNGFNVIAFDGSKYTLPASAELRDEIARVRYYPPKEPRPSQPRVSKGTINKWKQHRAEKMAGA